MAKLLVVRQASFLRAMVRVPKAISEILVSASLIKVQNPRGAEWFQDWLEELLWPYHAGGARILLPASHCGLCSVTTSCG